MNEYRRTPDSEKCFSLLFFLQILEYARNRKCLYDGKVRAVLCVVCADNNDEGDDDEKIQHKKVMFKVRCAYLGTKLKTYT